MNEIKKLNALALAQGFAVKDYGNGHIQVIGKLTVNWYPESKRKTAYVCGTKRSEAHATAEQVVRMAMEAPSIKPMEDRAKRKPSKNRRRKFRLLMRCNKCRWCNIVLTMQTATIEHIIPLARGGLDHHNNMALACRPCNEARGHDMPELKQVSQ